MPQTKSSTAQDIAKGRPTEIAHLNGYVVREGEALGVATPVNRTLNALIHVARTVRELRRDVVKRSPSALRQPMTEAPNQPRLRRTAVSGVVTTGRPS